MNNIYTISEINNLIKKILAKETFLQRIQLKGEISNFKKYASGHCYFTLKDANSTLKAVMFRSRAALLRFKPADGQMVIASGRVEVYERDGVYQLYVDNLFPDGIGRLMLEFEELKKKLDTEGLFSLEYKRKIPFMPKAVGIITSSSGAVLHDIITVSKRRNSNIKLLFYPVRVQGKESPEEIVYAIEKMNELALVDVLIVGRGGGSLEDLWSFNDERVVRAVASSKIPIISAVGHETDVTLCDFAADMRAATPSQAAELAVPDRLMLLENISNKQNRLIKIMQKKVENFSIKIDSLVKRGPLSRPEDILIDYEQRLDKYYEKINVLMADKILHEDKKLMLLSAKLDALSPLAVLARGYSFTTNKVGKTIKNVSDVQNGDVIKTYLDKGTIYSCVTDVEGR